MKICLTRLKVNEELRTAKKESAIIYDLDNEEQKRLYLEDLNKSKDDYLYAFSIVKDGE